jgi:FG-GAP-like repeat/FG-GAP repeat
MTGKVLGVVGIAAVLAGSAHAAPFVAAAAWSSSSQVKLVDGSGKELASFWAADAPQTEGVALANGEIVAGAGAAGRADVVALARSGDRLRSFLAGSPADGTGVTVAEAEITGDGRADLVTGVAGTLALWDGATGRRLWTSPAADGAVPVQVAAGGGIIAAAAGSTVRVYDTRGTRVLAFSAGNAPADTPVFVAAGDLDGDGTPELVVGANGAGLPQVQVFDGRTGDRLASFQPFDAAVTSVPVAIADVTGDGKPEILVGALVGGLAQVKAIDARGRDVGFAVAGGWGTSVALGAGDGNVAVAVSDWYTSTVDVFARDGSRLASVRPFAPAAAGLHVALADVDHDGNVDILTAPASGPRPTISVFDRHGNLRRSYDAFDPVLRNGVSLATGDVNGDGFADLVVAPENGAASTVRVLDGRDGTVVASFDAFPTGSWAGVHLAAGNVAGDGTAEIVAGASYGGPEVKSFDGTGHLIGSFFAFDASRDGGVWVATGDVTGNGYASIVAGSDDGPPEIRVFSAIGTLVSSFAVPELCCGGVRVATADIDDDGTAEILASGAVPDGLVEAFAADGRRVAAFHLFPGSYGPLEIASATKVNRPSPARTPPTTPAVRGPRWTLKRAPVYRFSSHDLDGSDALIRYRCAFDSTTLHACAARFSQRLRPGRHLLRVRAVDDDGARSPLAAVRVVVAHG